VSKILLGCSRTFGRFWADIRRYTLSHWSRWDCPQPCNRTWWARILVYPGVAGEGNGGETVSCLMLGHIKDRLLMPVLKKVSEQ